MSTTISKPTPFDYAMMGLTAIVWASAFVAIKVVVPDTGPLWLATWRVLIGFVALLPYAIWRGLIWPSNGKIWGLIAITAVFNVVLPFFLISWAEETIDAGVTSLLMGTGPFLALLGSHFSTTDDRITPPKIVGVLLGFTGVAVIVGLDAFRGLAGETLLSQMAAMGGALSYVVAGLLIRKINMPPIRLGTLVLGVGAVMLLGLALLVDGAPSTKVSPLAFWALIYLGIVPTALGQLLRFTLIKKVGYSTFSQALNLIPVFGIGMGALLLGEVVTLRTVLALVLVLAGLYVSRMSFGAKPA